MRLGPEGKKNTGVGGGSVIRDVGAGGGPQKLKIQGGRGVLEKLKRGGSARAGHVKIRKMANPVWQQTQIEHKTL